MGTEGCWFKFMKFVLVFFNFLVLAAGAIAIGLGAWALASEYGAKEMKAITGSELYEGGCIVLIVGGSIICILALCGCLGAFFENRVLLGIYFVIMLLILILFVVGAVLGFFFRDQIEATLEKQMRETITERFNVSYDKDDTNKLATDVWNKIQTELKCCGVSGNVSSPDAWFIYQSSKFFSQQPDSDRIYVPESCCNPNFKNATGLALCQKTNPDTNRPIQTTLDKLTNVTKLNPALYNNGCLSVIEDEIKNHILAIAGIAVAIIIVVFITVIFSVGMCVMIGKRKS
ncbi:tetraspanin-18 [Biomphalaria glabrata]|nr:tetraspanin-18-like [Biomphalaria glabrata]